MTSEGHDDVGLLAKAEEHLEMRKKFYQTEELVAKAANRTT